MGFFSEAETLIGKAGAVVSEVANDITSKAEGWGPKADAWVDGQVKKHEARKAQEAEEAATKDAGTGI